MDKETKEEIFLPLVFDAETQTVVFKDGKDFAMQTDAKSFKSRGTQTKDPNAQGPPRTFDNPPTSINVLPDDSRRPDQQRQ